MPSNTWLYSGEGRPVIITSVRYLLCDPVDTAENLATVGEPAGPARFTLGALVLAMALVIGACSGGTGLDRDGVGVDTTEPVTETGVVDGGAAPADDSTPGPAEADKVVDSPVVVSDGCNLEPLHDGTPAELLALDVLALQPRQPIDLDLFSTVSWRGDGIYPQGTPVELVEEQVWDAPSVRIELEELLRRQLGGDQAELDRALALFDDPSVVELFPDVTLRAAFVGMTGTLWEPAIDHVLTSGRFQPAVYSGTPARAGIIGAPRMVVFHRYNQHEHFAPKISLMGHEILHDKIVAGSEDGLGTSNPPAGLYEEAVAHALEAMVYLQVLHASPELARLDGEFSRESNTGAMFLLNSRPAGSPVICLHIGGDGRVAPGSPTFGAADFLSAGAEGYAGHAARVESGLMQSWVRDLLGNLGIAAGDAFDEQLVKSFSITGRGWLGPIERVQVSVLLGLITVGDIVEVAGLSEDEVVDLLALAPYLRGD